MIGNYNDVAMYDSYELFTTGIVFDGVECAAIESMIHILDCAKTNEQSIRDSVNEWGYRFKLLQNLAAANTIPTIVLEQIVLKLLGHLPCKPPKYGQ